jgi:hypothetical protein
MLTTAQQIQQFNQMQQLLLATNSLTVQVCSKIKILNSMCTCTNNKELDGVPKFQFTFLEIRGNFATKSRNADSFDSLYATIKGALYYLLCVFNRASLALQAFSLIWVSCPSCHKLLWHVSTIQVTPSSTPITTCNDEDRGREA